MVFNYYQTFVKSLKWGSVESVGYESLLLIHEIFLCKVLGVKAYGLVGILFAAVYLIARLLNLGLDFSFAPFFTLALKSKANFKHLIIHQLLLQCAIFLLAPLVAWFILPTSWLYRMLPLELAQSSIVLIVAWLAIFAEGMQRSIKHVLYLSLENKKVAYIQVSKISLYMAMVWGSLALGFVPTPGICIGMFLISSLCALYFSYHALHQFFSQLPNTQHDLPVGISKRITKARFHLFINQTAIELYSTNFIIPMIAAIGSIDQAGVLKLISSISYYITEIIKKTFGTASFTLFSHNKDSEHAHKQKIFGTITRSLYYVLTTICILIALYHRQCVALFSPECAQADWTAAYIFLIIHFSEYFLLTYKKFFMAHEQMHRLTFFKFIDVSLLILTLQFASSAFLITTIAASRLILISFFIMYSYWAWKIHPLSLSHK